MASEQYQSNDPFVPLYDYQFMVLTTFRRSGVGVATTVWFAPANGKLYVTTSTTTGKLKRVRNNGRVVMAPSDRVGNVQGESIEGRAHEVSPEEYEQAQKALRGKYGEQFDAIISNPRVSAATRTYIEIEPL